MIGLRWSLVSGIVAAVVAKVSTGADTYIYIHIHVHICIRTHVYEQLVLSHPRGMLKLILQECSRSLRPAGHSCGVVSHPPKRPSTQSLGTCDLGNNSSYSIGFG